MAEMPPTSSDTAKDGCAICACRQLHRYTALAHDGDGHSRVNIVECSHCHFAWQYPLGRTELQSVDHFAQSFYAEKQAESAYFDPATKSVIAELELGFLETLPVTGRRLLDVGGGNGAFASAAARRAWQATVVDPAIDPSRLESKEVRAFVGSLAALPPAEEFDVVTLWDVIEHLPDPFSFITEVRQHVRVGGWIVLETGNYKSADRIECGDGHWIYQLDHRWYFSPESATQVLRDNGFDGFRLAQRVLRPTWRGSADYPGPTPRQLAAAVLRKPWHLARHWQKHRRLQTAARWPLAGLGIFCIAGQRVR